MLLFACSVNAQIYYHDFGTSTITTHPYNVAPTTINSHLSGSSWTNSANSWTSNTGATGQALTLVTGPGTFTINLTFNVANNFQADITSFNFWRQRSNSGPQNWSLSINGIPAGSGTTPTAGAPIGVTNVSSPILVTGTVTVTLELTGAAGGNFRLDDFTLNGTVTSTCNTAVITSFSPASGPANTIMTITGSGFTSASSVKFNGTEAASFTVISDTSIQATAPVGASAGTISVTAAGCDGVSATPFTYLSSQCNTATDLFISELYDQKTQSGGMIELYNPTNATINLNGYVLQRYGNITDTAPTAGYILSLSGTIAPGATYLIACVSPDPTICSCPTANTSMGSGFNGNDKFELLKNGALIDVVNVPFTGPGYTLIRKPNAVAPVATYNINDWNNTAHNNTSPNTYCQDVGSHTVTPSIPPTITHPVTRTVCENTTTTFSTSVSTPAGFTYQWKVLNTAGVWVNVVNGTNYSGATTNTLTVNPVPLSFNNLQYYCEIKSTTCILVTNAAQLIVSPIPPIANVTTIQPTCAVPTGTITVNSPLGTGITYSLDGTNFVPGTTFTNVAPGNYNVSVKNATGCISTTLMITIDTPAGGPAVADVSVSHPTCTTPTGSITINSPTGTGFTYSIDGSTFQTGLIFTNLVPGSYVVTVKDVAGCTSVTPSITVNPVPAIPAIADVTVTNPTCIVPTGTITINSPLAPNLTYSIDGINFVSNTSFTNLTPGTYTITVKNAVGCTSVTSNIIVNPAVGAPAVATVTVIQPACTILTGTITITSPTGTNLTYSIDGVNFVSTTSFTNLAPGTYTITVKNISGCTSTTPGIIINQGSTTPVVSPATPLEACANNFDGFSFFNLTTAGNEILNGQTGLTITYHLTEIGADFGTTP
ncbi:lamin tail domain-containing protein, partial [Flavobacterium cerinum]